MARTRIPYTISAEAEIRGLSPTEASFTSDDGVEFFMMSGGEFALGYDYKADHYRLKQFLPGGKVSEVHQHGLLL